MQQAVALQRSRPARWESMLHALKAYVEQHAGRYPAAHEQNGADEEARRLSSWALMQRMVSPESSAASPSPSRGGLSTHHDLGLTELDLFGALCCSAGPAAKPWLDQS